MSIGVDKQDTTKALTVPDEVERLCIMLVERGREVYELRAEVRTLKEKLRNSIQMGTQTTRPPLVITGDD